MSDDPGFGGYVHDALYYDSDDDMLQAAVPFLRAGLDRDESVVLVCGSRNAALLTEALGGEPRLEDLSHPDIYRRAPRGIAAYQRMLDVKLALGARRVRLLGEADFGAGVVDWTEWIRFEAIANRAFAPYPLWGLCMYDTRVMPPEILDAGEMTHPTLVRGTTRMPNPRYLDPAEFLRESPLSVPDPLEATEPWLDLENVTDLSALRRRLHDALAFSALSRAQISDFVLAISEVATNAAVHGLPPVRIRLWSSQGRWLCTVADHGPGFDDPFAGYAPSPAAHAMGSGSGLWLARHLCDHLDAAMTPSGFTVRLEMHDPRT